MFRFSPRSIKSSVMVYSFMYTCLRLNTCTVVEKLFTSMPLRYTQTAFPTKKGMMPHVYWFCFVFVFRFHLLLVISLQDRVLGTKAAKPNLTAKIIKNNKKKKNNKTKKFFIKKPVVCNRSKFFQTATFSKKKTDQFLWWPGKTSKVNGNLLLEYSPSFYFQRMYTSLQEYLIFPLNKMTFPN